MAKNQNHLQETVLSLARVHFFYVLAFVAAIMIYDSWKLITPEAVLQRWTVATVMLVTTTLVWYSVRKISTIELHKTFVYVFILLDIVVAMYLTYAERGMASRAVALFAIPIAVAAVLRSRSALFGTALLSTAAYSFAAVKYFVDYFNEGYKIELYGTIGFYSAMFFVLTALLWIVVQPSSKK